MVPRNNNIWFVEALFLPVDIQCMQHGQYLIQICTYEVYICRTSLSYEWWKHVLRQPTSSCDEAGRWFRSTLFCRQQGGCKRRAILQHSMGRSRRGPAKVLLIVCSYEVVAACVSLDLFRTAVPFWGQTTWYLSGVSLKRDWKSNSPKGEICLRGCIV